MVVVVAVVAAVVVIFIIIIIIIIGYQLCFRDQTSTVQQPYLASAVPFGSVKEEMLSIQIFTYMHKHEQKSLLPYFGHYIMVD